MSRIACLLVVGLVACISHRPMPITASDVAEASNGASLVSYLAQRDASASVCDLAAGEPHLVRIDAGARNELVRGLRDNGIDPVLWRDCVQRLARSSDAESDASMLDEVARAYATTIADKRLEYVPTIESQLLAMHALLADRPGGIAPHAQTSADLIEYLRAAVDKGQLGPAASRLAAEMIAADELAHGMREGRPVTDGTLDGLLAVRDSATLRRAALRLTDPRLRARAQRFVIRLNILASPYLAVTQNPSSVEETMMRLGVNPIALTMNAPVRAIVDRSVTSGRSVRIRQDLRDHKYTFLGYSGDGSVSVLPQPSLKGTLHVTVTGIDRPVTLCGSRDDFDPSPCLSASDLSSGSALAYVDRDGTLRFTEHLDARDALLLASNNRDLVIPLRAAGTPVVEVTWRLEYETPDDMLFESRRSGHDGPDLQVHVEPLSTGRLAYAVVDGDESFEGIVERSRASDFHIITRGGGGSSGLDGATGSDGAPGFQGSIASCPSFQGTNGGRGGDGGAGGDGYTGHSGGSGGNVLVAVTKNAENVTALLSLLRGSIRSEGGAGGSGGAGGRGGRGGSGGAGGQGATCVDSEGHVTILSGGSPGLAGTDGRTGFDGIRGANGHSGEVTVKAVQ